MDIKKKNNKKLARKKRVSMRLKGKFNLPRLAVFRSNRFVYAQIIDDLSGSVICAENSKFLKGKIKKEAAKETGRKIAEKALAKNITKVIFDRAGYLYHGRVKELADGARESGLEF
ncbi:MAG: 50S ribosomal protein L18 [bacterium]